jgi:Pyridine nucleotide-disulphide oxidoreductase
MVDCEVAILGAGPYGLSVAAHLPSFEKQVFGATMAFWQNHMPKGMRLRSPREASNISAPGRRFSLEDFEREHNLEAVQPLPVETFIEYGMWFQRRIVPPPDERAVQLLERENGCFRLTLEGGDSLVSRAVVVAAGIRSFAWRPPEFAQLASDRVSHSVDLVDLSSLRGQKVLVVGGGQSAVESAALLHEVGATVALLVRAPRINWLTRSGLLHKAKPLRRMLYAPSDIGPAGVSWLIAFPDAFRRLPRRLQDPLALRSIRPAASAWLLPRVRELAITTGRSVDAARVADGHVEITLDGGDARAVDHVLLATGYCVDIAKYEFLSPRLLGDIAREGGYPRLGKGFETSISGLYFVGAPAAWSFGPLFRFVAGAEYAAASLASALGSRRGANTRRLRGARTGTRGEASAE